MTRCHTPGATLLALAVGTLVGFPGVLGAQDARSGKLTLREAVALAREQYPSLQAALEREDAASAAAGVAGAERWPQLRAQSSLSRFEEPMLVAPLHGFSLEAVPAFDRTLLRGDLSLSYTLFDGGARSGRIREARSEAAASAAAAESARMALTSRVVSAYLEVLTARDVDAAQRSQIESLERELRRVRQFLEEGRAARVELLRVEAALADASARLVTTDARLDLARRELARLVGVEVDRIAPSSLDSVALAPGSEVGELDSLIARARASSPELAHARAVRQAAEAGRRVAGAAWWPHLDLAGGYQAYSDPDFEGALEWQAALSVSYPLFTGGARASAVSAAAARARAAGQDERLAELRVDGEVDRALSATQEATARVEAIELAVQHQSEVARIELLSLEAGAGTQTDYLRAEAELLRVRSALVEARNTQIAARVELARITGELDDGWLAQNLETSR